MAIAAFFDVDHTIIEGNASRLFGKYFYKLGLLTKWQLFKASYLNLLHRLNLMDEEAILNVILKLFKRWDTKFVEECCEKAFELIVEKRISSRVAEHMRFHQAQGHYIILSTAMPEPLAIQFQKYFHTEGLICTILKKSKGNFTGDVQLLNFGTHKKQPLLKYAKKHKLNLKKSYFYADSMSDKEAMELVGKPIAVNPDKKLRAHAKKHGWEIIKH
ncbi:MAG: HAD family hydrolase [Candidatus Nanoarchaeia archaeon]